MTREQAIKGFEDMKKGLYPFYPDEYFDMAIKALDQEPATKNDLGVDCISRADAIRVASGYCHPSNVAKELAKLRSVTPQEPTIKALGEELRKARKGIADEKVLIGYNMAVAICNKHLGESEVDNGNVDN